MPLEDKDRLQVKVLTDIDSRHIKEGKVVGRTAYFMEELLIKRPILKMNWSMIKGWTEVTHVSGSISRL
jgi:hypothetical protein